jgi:hypothetical protein
MAGRAGRDRGRAVAVDLMWSTGGGGGGGGGGGP